MTSGPRVAQDAFVRARQAHWQQLETLLDSSKILHKLPAAKISAVSGLYRSVCADLMRARGVGYSRDLVAHLDVLAARAHNSLYRAEPYRLHRAWQLVVRDFPGAIRDSARFIAASAALLLIPFAISLIAVLMQPELAFEVVPRGQIEMLASSYTEGFADGRAEATDAAMTGFYVNNNIGVAFRCFAGGIFVGLGSVFFLVFNGISIGATLGYVWSVGGGYNILTFMTGHGAFELTAIVVAGGAGLRMGYALVRTHGLTRLGSLRNTAIPVGRLIVGAAIMLAVAALIEGFWSPSAIPGVIKWGVSSVLWLGVMAYFVFAGRRRPRPSRAPRSAASEQADA